MKTLVIGLLILIVLCLVLTWSPSSNFENEFVVVLWRQAARYAVAAAQDDQPIIAVLHANYAMGYLLAIKDLVTAEEFKGATGQDLLNFERELAQIQDQATIRLAQTCPDIVPNQDPDLLRAAYQS